MRRVWAILVFIALMSVTAPPASAKADVLAGGELEVTHSPDALWLRPRETDEFQMTIRNDGDRHLNASLEYLQIECPGGTSGTFSRSFLSLSPGESGTITVDVRSYANALLRYCLDETHIRVSWGPDLTLDERGHPERQTVEGDEVVESELHYEFTYGVLWLGMIVALLVLVGVYYTRMGGTAQGNPSDPTT